LTIVKNYNMSQNLTFRRIIKKLSLSAFVVITFIMYALNKSSTEGNNQLGLSQPGTGAQPSEAVTSSDQSSAATSTVVPQRSNDSQSSVSANPNTLPTEAAPTPVPPTAIPPTAVLPTAVPPVVAQAPKTGTKSGQYTDGTYTGPQIDAQFGLVQVQAVIQNGKIADVQVLQYPSDRRTSVRINNVALPWLKQEVIQSQTANVDLVTGATLTSEAYEMSLQSALDQAKGTL
jgi:uncharacterized protein with FMN-binding domain